jgi:uncharacterized protein YegP (UPF0339 family)
MLWNIFRDTNGYWRWNAQATNYRILAQSSEAYHNRFDCVACARLFGYWGN